MMRRIKITKKLLNPLKPFNTGGVTINSISNINGNIKKVNCQYSIGDTISTYAGVYHNTICLESLGLYSTDINNKCTFANLMLSLDGILHIEINNRTTDGFTLLSGE